MLRVDNQLADQQTALDNRQPSAFMEKINFYGGLLENGDITREQHNAVVGIPRHSGLSASEEMQLKTAAREQAALEVLGQDSMRQPTAYELEELDVRAEKLFYQAIGQEAPKRTRTLPPRMIEDVAQKLADAEVDELSQGADEFSQEMADVRAKGVISGAQLLEIERRAKEIKGKRDETKVRKEAEKATWAQPGAPVGGVPGAKLSRENPVLKFFRGRKKHSDDMEEDKERKQNRLLNTFGNSRPY